MARDSSRVRIKLPALDTTGDGTADQSAGDYLCAIGSVSFSGFSRGTIQTTCSETAADGWGDVWRIFEGGKFVDPGTISLQVDWDPVDAGGGNPMYIFRNSGGASKNYIWEFPLGSGETTALSITWPVIVTNFTPEFGLLEDGDEARLTASMEWKLSGAPTITPAT